MAFRYVNRKGTVYIKTTKVTVNDDNVVYSFPNHSFLGTWYQGMVFVDIEQQVPTGTSSMLPVLFETNGVTQTVTKAGGDDYEVADISGTGVYMFWFDKATNTLQLIAPQE